MAVSGLKPRHRISGPIPTTDPDRFSGTAATGDFLLAATGTWLMPGETMK
ncbi:hypothetical protein ACFQDP_15675 [Methylorubrum zatmanii]|uniref:Uncharacterized protein n=1 Tax=Methylorubrum zatmanii TaxID=29429 RepID=A0ABW1WT13_9HYPH